MTFEVQFWSKNKRIYWNPKIKFTLKQASDIIANTYGIWLKRFFVAGTLHAGRTEKMVHAWLLKNVPCSLIYSQVHFNFIFSTGVRTNNFFQLGTSKLSTRLMYCPPAYLHLNLKICFWKFEFEKLSL